MPRHNPRLQTAEERPREALLGLEGFRPPVGKPVNDGTYIKLYKEMFDSVIGANPAYGLWARDNICAIMTECRTAVLQNNPNLTNEDLAIRFGWSSDWDQVENRVVTTPTEPNTYEFDYCGETIFRIQRVDAHFYAVGIIGVLMGNIGRHLKSVQIQVGQKTGREFSGALLPLTENAMYLMPDSIFTVSAKKIEVRFHTDFTNVTRCTAMPFMFVVIPAGA